MKDRTRFALLKRIQELEGDERRIMFHVFHALLDRLDSGREQYGQWDVHDGRDYRREADEEDWDRMLYRGAEMVLGDD